MASKFKQIVSEPVDGGFARYIDNAIFGEITWDVAVGMPTNPRDAFNITAAEMKFFDDANNPAGGQQFPNFYFPVWWSKPGERLVRFLVPNVRVNPDISGNPGAQPNQQPYTKVTVDLVQGVHWETGGKWAPHPIGKRIVEPMPEIHFLKEPGPAELHFEVTLNGLW